MQVPGLKEATPVLYKTSLETVTKHATSASTYVASFTLAQVGTFKLLTVLLTLSVPS